MTANTNATGWYGQVFKAWQVKALGAKPTAEQLATIHALGARPGKQALAIAMASRDSGVSGAQIVMACGAPQLNKMRGMIASGVLKRDAVGPNELGHSVYKVTLTAKGTAAIKRTAEAAEKAALKADEPVKKAKVKKATSKAKGKAKPVVPASPAVPVEVTTGQPEGAMSAPDLTTELTA